MPSQTVVVFDIPQNRPSVLFRFYQDVRGYDNQQNDAPAQCWSRDQHTFG